MPDFFYPDSQVRIDNSWDFVDQRIKKLYGKVYYQTRVESFVNMLLTPPKHVHTYFGDVDTWKDFSKTIKDILGDYRYTYAVHDHYRWHMGNLGYTGDRLEVQVPEFSYEEIVDSDHWERYLVNKEIRSELCLL